MSLLTILRDLQEVKHTVVDLLTLVIEGDGELGSFRNALFSPRNRASLLKLFDKLIEDDKGGPIMKDWMFPHSVLLVCGRIHAEMEDAKPLLRMNTADVTPEFIEQWDIYRIMEGVSTSTTLTLTTVLQAAGESKASQAKAKSAKSKNRVTVCIYLPASMDANCDCNLSGSFDNHGATSFLALQVFRQGCYWAWSTGLGIWDFEADDRCSSSDGTLGLVLKYICYGTCSGRPLGREGPGCMSASTRFGVRQCEHIDLDFR